MYNENSIYLISYLIRIRMDLYLHASKVSSLIRLRHENFIVVATTLHLKTHVTLT